VREVIDAFLKDRLETDKDWKSKEEFGHHES
ncbi:MAG: dinitrogenase iron-molybdenum cofactor, partial [Thermoplasmata archaeon]